MSASSIAGVYTIEGCRDGLPVLKIVKVTEANCETFKFSDGGTEDTPSLWTAGPCAEEPAVNIDPEVVCASNDGGETVVKAIAVFDVSVNPPTVTLYDYNGAELTGYEVVECQTPVDRETISSELCNAEGTWQVVTFVNVDDPEDIVGPIFINPNGVVSTDPGDLTKCKDTVILEDIDCATANPNVKECNSDAILSELQTANVNLTNAVTQLTAINENTDNLEELNAEISAKLDVLVDIKDAINDFATQNNADLTGIFDSLVDQIAALEDIKIAIEAGNVTLGEIKVLIGETNTLLTDVLAELTAFKDSFETNIAIVIEKLDSIILSVENLLAELEALHTTVQTEFDQTQVKLDEIKEAVMFSKDTYDVVDCEGNLVVAGEEVTKTVVLNSVQSNICNVTELADAIAEAINGNAIDYTDLLTSIDTKLDELVLIKDELVTANTTLTGIKTDTAQINVNLEEILVKLDTQIALLTDLKAEAIATNANLVDIKAVLDTISIDIITIKDDIALIKVDVADIKTGVQSIDTKLDTVITSLSNIEDKLDTIVTELVTINTTLQTEFDETQVKLDTLIDAVENIGVDCNSSVHTTLCNVSELADAIADAINGNAIDYTDLLTSIDTKLDELALIKDELTTANTTLSDIKTDTAQINVNLADIILKLDTQINLLTELKAEAVATNTNLAIIQDTLNAISLDIVVIKEDIATIKNDINSIKTSVESIDSKLDIVITSLTNIETQLGTITTELEAIKILLQSEFDETQVKLDEIIAGVMYGKDTYTVTDCNGEVVSADEQVQKTVVLNSVNSRICNVTELADAINDGATEIDYTDILTSIDEKLDVLDRELVYTSATKFNNGTDNFYSREMNQFDSQTASNVMQFKEYSTDGVNWSSTTPSGTHSIGWLPETVATTCTTTREQISIPAGTTVTVPANDNVIGWNAKVLDTANTLVIGGVDYKVISHAEGYNDVLATSVTVTTSAGAGILIITRKICL